MGKTNAHRLVPIEIIEVACVLGLANKVEPLGAVLVVHDCPVRRVLAHWRANAEATRQLGEELDVLAIVLQLCCEGTLDVAVIVHVIIEVNATIRRWHDSARWIHVAWAEAVADS